MISVPELKLGFNDAENYQRRENKELFNKIFVKNIFLDQLLDPSKFFLIGEKGTGKTAYAVFLVNNHYHNNIANLKYIRETDYEKFITMKNQKNLQLSDYPSIWKVIILLLLSKSVEPSELDHNPFTKPRRLKALWAAIDEYYNRAFSPEILYALNWLENSKVAAEMVTKYLKIGGEENLTTSFQESKFQVNLLYIENQFKKALSDIKLKENHLLFIDGIDIRPGLISYPDYLNCIKGLAEATWHLNNDFFPSIKDSKGRFRCILLLRPDIFNSIGLQNQTNKIRDNSVFLDWRTTYPNHRNSYIFELSDKLLSAQQLETHEFGESWDYYVPWKATSTDESGKYDPSFVSLLRISYSRPRDIVTILQLLQEEFIEKSRDLNSPFLEKDFAGHDFQNKYSEYLMGGIKDQLAFYYSKDDYEMFLRFFTFLQGKSKFSYKEYVEAYKMFTDYILKNLKDRTELPEFVETQDIFLQFLYDANIICFIEELETESLFRFCYRERSPSNISPKVRPNVNYRIHYGLRKALNVGTQKMKS